MTTLEGTRHETISMAGRTNLPTPAAPTVDVDAAPRTRLPRLALPEESDELDRVRLGFSREEGLNLGGSVVAGAALGLLLTVVVGIIPIGWLLVVSFFWFVCFYTMLTFLREHGPAVVDRFWTVMLWAAGVVVVGTLALLIGFILIRGWDVFSEVFTSSAPNFLDRFHFFTDDMSTVGPLSGLDSGGIFHALIGTLIQIGIALILTVPLGLTTAIFLAEVGGKFARIVRTIVEAMTALPSVVAGLFIYAAVIVLITRQSSGFAASLAISVLMLPIMIRSADLALRLVPGNLREAGLALGAGQWATVWYVVLPTVRSGLTTAMILGTAHGIGETAPVLLTAGFTASTNFNPFEGPMVSLPLQALEFIKSPQLDMIARGFATAAFLLVVVLVLFGTARAIGGSDEGSLTDRQLDRLRRKSQRTAARFRYPASPSPITPRRTASVPDPVPAAPTTPTR